MILMPIIMVSPLWGLVLFYTLSVGTAIPIYAGLLLIAAYCHFLMMWSMRAKPKTGLDAMIGKDATVIEDIDPEGRVAFRGEIWTATAADETIVTGKRVKIVAAKDLVLTVSVLDEHVDEVRLK